MQDESSALSDETYYLKCKKSAKLNLHFTIFSEIIHIKPAQSFSIGFILPYIFNNALFCLLQ